MTTYSCDLRFGQQRTERSVLIQNVFCDSESLHTWTVSCKKGTNPSQGLYLFRDTYSERCLETAPTLVIQGRMFIKPHGHFNFLMKSLPVWILLSFPNLSLILINYPSYFETYNFQLLKLCSVIAKKNLHGRSMKHLLATILQLYFISLTC